MNLNEAWQNIVAQILKKEPNGTNIHGTSRAPDKSTSLNMSQNMF
jgi:hypothetical protein